MKKLYNLLLLPVVALGILSCQDEVTRSDSPEFKEDAMQVYFTADNESNLELLPSDESFTVKVGRVDTKSAATVNVKMSTANADCFEAPSQVSFEAGQATADIVVKVVKTPDPFIRNVVEFEIEDSFTNPYVANAAGTPVLTIGVTITDWTLYSVGTYESEFFEDSWEQEILYSNILNKYMLKDIYEEGYSFVFSIDPKTGAIDGETLDKDEYYIYESMSDLSGYGLVTTHVPAGEDYIKYTYYSKTYKAIVLYSKFTVSAGSFGWATEVFYFGDDVDGIVGEEAAAE